MYSLKSILNAGAFAALAVMATGCGGSGQFPNFVTLTAQAVPATGRASTMLARAAILPPGAEKNVPTAPSIVSAVPQLFATLSGVSYSSSSTAFTTAFDPAQNFIGQVLADYDNDSSASTSNTTGTVKSLFVVLQSAHSNIQNLSTSGCTAIPSTTTITQPIWGTFTSFNAWTDTGKYTCKGSAGDTVILYGITEKTDKTGCKDQTYPHEYYVMDGYGQNDGSTSSQDSANYGIGSDLFVVKKFYYNGCTGDLKLNFGHYGKYSGSQSSRTVNDATAGSEFSSRFEITGNVDTGTFTLRSQFIDGNGTSYQTHTTFAGSGTSRGTTAAPAYFAMGYRSDSCTVGTHTCPTPGNSVAAIKFCAKTPGASGQYELDSSGTNCPAATTTAIGAVTLLESSDLPTSAMLTTAVPTAGGIMGASAFGL